MWTECHRPLGKDSEVVVEAVVEMVDSPMVGKTRLRWFHVFILLPVWVCLLDFEFEHETMGLVFRWSEVEIVDYWGDAKMTRSGRSHRVGARYTLIFLVKVWVEADEYSSFLESKVGVARSLECFVSGI